MAPPGPGEKGRAAGRRGRGRGRAPMKAEALLALLARERIPALTVIYGEEGWFRERAARLIRERFLGEEEDGFTTLDAPRGPGDAEGTPLGIALDEARTYPMFGGRKVILYRARSLPGDALEPLLSFLRSDPDFCRFVLSLDTLGAAEAAALLEAGAAVAEARRLFATPFPGKPAWLTPLTAWLAARAAERGKRLARRTAQLLVETQGERLGTLEAVLERLVTEIGERPEITEDDVRGLGGGGVGFHAFALGEAVYEGDLARCYRVIRSSFREGIVERGGAVTRERGQVASRLLWSIRFRLGKIREIVEAGGAEGGGGGGAWRRRLAEAAASLREETIRRHLGLLAEAEAELRTPVPPELVIEMLVAKLLEEPDGRG